MVKEILIKRINSELTRADQAMKEGNDGMTRVCARRACGNAISFWLQKNPHQSYGESSINQLKSIQVDNTVPEEVRDAAKRLTAHISVQSDSSMSSDPINDANTIIKYCIE
jgi:uncharacterized protein (UPF0147 family)